MVKEIEKNIWMIPVPLPDNPLRQLNCYVIRDAGGRSLIVDTGFNRRECLDALMAGVEELELDLHETDVFLTHLHADHTGNAPALIQLGCRAIMGAVDYELLDEDPRGKRVDEIRAEGMPPELLERLTRGGGAVFYAPGPFEAETVDEGAHLSYGGYTFECIRTPGHTPGHMCLYDGERGLMLLGDHVLFDITPNICRWEGVADSLGDYLESLRRVMSMNIDVALPAHRGAGSVSVRQRAAELIEGHRLRLDETERLVKERPGSTAYDLAGRMTWRIRAKDWDSFPTGQKWFAIGEAMAHLDRLAVEGRVERRVSGDGMIGYY